VDLDKYIQIFITESEEYLQQIHDILLGLEKGGANDDLTTQLMGNTHSIKGMSRTVGFSDIEKLCHHLEDFVQKLPGNQTVDTQTVNLLFEGFNLVEKMIQNVKSGSSQEIPFHPFLDKLKTAPYSPSPSGSVTSSISDVSSLKEASHVRVKIETLNNMFNIIGEALLCHNQIQTISNAFPSRILKMPLFQMKRLIKELHLQITVARMTPVKILTDNIARTIRNVSGSAGKEISFKVIGEEIEMDRSIIEGLEVPLMHIVRNTIDHGIETPQLRKERGKPPKGAITLTINRTKETAVIKVEDDGNGMDTELIKQKAIKKGIISPEEGGNLTPENILMLVCAPNFSTAEKVTETSGRGVGMNIVKKKIEALGGNIAIHSQNGVGSRIVLKIPLTLAIMPVFLINVDSRFFAIPVNKVISNIMILPEEISLHNQKESCMVKKNRVPLYRLRKLLKLKPAIQNDNQYLSVVITEASDQRAGFIVDNFLGQQDVVVRSLKPPLNKMKTFSGITLLGNGESALLLNVDALDIEQKNNHFSLSS